MLLGGHLDSTEQTEYEEDDKLTESLIDGLYREVRQTRKKDNYVTSKKKVLNPVHKEDRPKSKAKRPLTAVKSVLKKSPTKPKDKYQGFVVDFSKSDYDLPPQKTQT
jgi:hypothetical protein